MAQFAAEDLGGPESPVCRLGGVSGQDHSLPRRPALPRDRPCRWLVLLGRRGIVNAALAAAGFEGVDLL